jgi:ATP-dependent Clp protease adaptor protein ClpS
MLALRVRVLGSSPNDEDRDVHGDGDVVVERAPHTARARRWCVVFYNDDYTTKWFVVHVLEQFFHMNETTATAFMLAVHTQGKGVAGMYTRDIAETKAAEVSAYAREFEMPLKVTAEPDDEDDGK